MTPLLDSLTSQLGNQFVGGGLVLMFTGSAMALMRKLPTQAADWVKSRFTRTVTIDGTDPLFDYVTYWLDGQQQFSKSRFLRASTSLNLSQEKTNAPPDDVSKKQATMRVFFSPSVGQHYIRYKGTLVSISMSSKENSPSAGGDARSMFGGADASKRETYQIKAYGSKDNEVLKTLVREIIAFGTKETEGVRLYHSVWGGWESHGYMKMRPLNTVVLPAGVAETVLADMREFRESEQWYRELGIPWHRGLLFHGLPGTGKTSLAASLAGELGMDVYLLNLSGNNMNDERLESLMARVRPGCMVILEDVDCTVPTRDERPDGKGISLSGLLNCLDGITSREGCMIVMTTNRREILDSALTRPGRIDVELKFGLANDDQIERLAARIGVDRSGLSGETMTMAEVQKVLLQRRKDAKPA